VRFWLRLLTVAVIAIVLLGSPFLDNINLLPFALAPEYKHFLA